MQYKNLFHNELNWKSVSMLIILAVLPNMLGMLNITLPYGKFHFFQFSILLAAAVFGPWGGLISGAFGSIYSAAVMHNPYIVIGNMILGFFAGYFFLKGMDILKATLLAFTIQLPWLFATDIYLVNMPVKVVIFIAVSLLVSNAIWAMLVQRAYKPVQSIII
jgi:hypothetical protein